MKRDANAVSDDKNIIYSQIEGKVIVSIPLIGFLAILYQSVFGKICVISLTVCCYLIGVLSTRIYKDVLQDEEDRKNARVVVYYIRELPD